MTEEFINAYPQEPLRPPYRPHILNLLAPALWTVSMLIPPLLILIALNSIGVTGQPLLRAGEWMFGGLYLIFVISYFMMQIIFWYLDAWLLMPSGLIDIQLVSLFNRRVAQLGWNQVQDVKVTTQGLLASLFSFGDITVQTAGKQGMFELRSIPRARDVAQLISELSAAATHEGIILPVEHGAPTHRLGEILVQEGKLTPNELSSALQEQEQTGKQFGQIVLARRLISREDLVHALSQQYHLPHIDLSRYDLDPNVLRLMPYETAMKYHAIPIHHSPDNVLSIAIAQPSSEKFTELMEQFDMPLTFLVADEAYIQEAIVGHYLSDESDLRSPQSPPAGPDTSENEEASE